MTSYHSPSVVTFQQSGPCRRTRPCRLHTGVCTQTAQRLVYPDSQELQNQVKYVEYATVQLVVFRIDLDQHMKPGGRLVEKPLVNTTLLPHNPSIRKIGGGWSGFVQNIQSKLNGTVVELPVRPDHVMVPFPIVQGIVGAMRSHPPFAGANEVLECQSLFIVQNVTAGIQENDCRVLRKRSIGEYSWVVGTVDRESSLQSICSNILRPDEMAAP